MDRKSGYRVSFDARRRSHRTPHLRLIVNKLLALVAGWTLTPSPMRVAIHRLRGVRFSDPGRIFIGEHVTLDAVFPERISIGKDVMLTSGTMILTHYYQPEYAGHVFMPGEVKIGDGVFFGGRSMVIADIEIGNGAIIAAGAVVAGDVASNTIVGGIPAREIGRRGAEPVPDTMPSLDELMRSIRDDA